MAKRRQTLRKGQRVIVFGKTAIIDGRYKGQLVVKATDEPFKIYKRVSPVSVSTLVVSREDVVPF